MNKGLLSSAAFGALLVAGGNAFAADAIILPEIVPVEVVEVEEVNPATITIEATLAKQDDDWEFETELEAEIVRNGTGFRLNLFENIEFPDEHSPGFRLTIFRELGNLQLGVFGGIFGDDLAFPAWTGDWLWEIGLGLQAQFGPVEIEAEVRREQEFGGGATFFADAEATIGLGEMFALIAGVEVEFDAPPEVTGHVAAEIALGPVTIIPSFSHRFYGPTFRNILGLEVQYQASDRFTIKGGVERTNDQNNGLQPLTFWGGFELVLGGAGSD